MNILLTGASGLLGGHIAAELLRRGYRVKALYRSQLAQFSQLPWVHEVEWIKGAIACKSDVVAAARGCQAIIHAAARTDPSPSDYESYYPANVLGTKNVLQAAKECGMERLVYVSTAAVYQPGTLANPSTEESPYAWKLMKSGYIASKYQAQHLVRDAVKEGVQAVIVNPTFMLGPCDFKPSSGAMIRHVLQRRSVFYPGEGGKNFIDARDAAVATVNALTRGQVGESYLLANENIPYRRFFPLVAGLSGTKRWLIPVPASIMQFGGRFGSAAERLLGRSFRLNYLNSVLITQDNYYSGERARRELGMPASPIQKAIIDAIDWFNSR